MCHKPISILCPQKLFLVVFYFNNFYFCHLVQFIPTVTLTSLTRLILRQSHALPPSFTSATKHFKIKPIDKSPIKNELRYQKGGQSQ